MVGRFCLESLLFYTSSTNAARSRDSFRILSKKETSLDTLLSSFGVTSKLGYVAVFDNALFFKLDFAALRIF